MERIPTAQAETAHAPLALTSPGVAAGLSGKVRQLKILAVALVSAMLVACATTPVAPRTEHLFNDALFVATSEHISADDIFALSDDMQHYLGTQIANPSRSKDRQRALVDALYVSIIGAEPMGSGEWSPGGSAT
jgi:hypothetical protein